MIKKNEFIEKKINSLSKLTTIAMKFGEDKREEIIQLIKDEEYLLMKEIGMSNNDQIQNEENESENDNYWPGLREGINSSTDHEDNLDDNNNNDNNNENRKDLIEHDIRNELSENIDTLLEEYEITKTKLDELNTKKTTEYETTNTITRNERYEVN